MSEIDKLINQAFPDELRDVEPIDVDEDAILSMTLEHLGLKPSPKLELPKPVSGPRRRPRHTEKQEDRPEPEFVEVPVVVHHRWMDWAGWAIAACLVLVFAVNWGPWLMNNLDFGLKPRSTGEVDSQESSGGGLTVSGSEYVLQDGQNVSVKVTGVTYGEEDTVTIGLTITPVMEAVTVDLDQFDIKVTGDGTGTVERLSRSNEGNAVTLRYRLGGVRVITLDIKQAVTLTDSSGTELGFGYKDIDQIWVNFNSGHADSLLLGGERFEFEKYGGS